ncbi:response regulator [Rubellicoccus peritrichatus]|uniref:Response regulator n=1 Tax=Rubellicoccus peritrichatus TaxID=3080537 RepID=A0AAQ3L8C4_9BACT|nr:response regulator [Puniceicoccus sp. CR14]WOO39789.1 response regulator [Puniceicoccus sp. CR14]
MKKILIADDDPVMVKLFEFNLRKAGFHLLICREGLSVISRAKDERPDIAIFDLMLPGMSGQELIRAFKGDPELKDIPIIVVTGQGKDSTRDNLISDGADSVFTKPFSPSALLSRLSELL